MGIIFVNVTNRLGEIAFNYDDKKTTKTLETAIPHGSNDIFDKLSRDLTLKPVMPFLKRVLLYKERICSLY